MWSQSTSDGARRKRCNGEDNDCCTEENPCTEGDGDCDNHDQCSGSLVCGNDNCVGYGFDGSDDCCTGKGRAQKNKSWLGLKLLELFCKNIIPRIYADISETLFQNYFTFSALITNLISVFRTGWDDDTLRRSSQWASIHPHAPGHSGLSHTWRRLFCHYWWRWAGRWYARLCWQVIYWNNAKERNWKNLTKYDMVPNPGIQATESLNQIFRAWTRNVATMPAQAIMTKTISWWTFLSKCPIFYT